MSYISHTIMYMCKNTCVCKYMRVHSCVSNACACVYTHVLSKKSRMCGSLHMCDTHGPFKLRVIYSVIKQLKHMFEAQTHYCHKHLACLTVRYERRLHVLIRDFE